ncbi:MAG: chorismate synthase [Verrucomicrobia bacterium]|nr:chorismate synthase [Verrucomicrobiota bacterium]MBU4247808.1 chorismate synthase [Verrucomicrobiota bacterium]MBU4292097.1 chorismate synthase [Verrucomicrobiota bacterium]MBU4498322.1 chorismate synthase [Verrucomicrobiota bacterium]MCG2678919.1 chorismate synthase [Kiritimatiellia bacterium]
MSSSFGTRFKVTTFGESHGKAIGAVVDGCPARLPLNETDIQPQLDRRRPGQSALTTTRQETDRVTILSGVDQGLTLGSPIALIIENTDIRPADYTAIAAAPRPSHADFTYRIKYGITAHSGGGRAGARETVGRVAAGAVAEKFLKTIHGVDIVAWVSSVGSIDTPNPSLETMTRTHVDADVVRCPDPAAARRMIEAIEAARKDGDSLGGIISCVCRHVPAGWGEPVFDKLNALLAHAMLSIPAVKGFEIGSGFGGARLRGSEHNDLFIAKGGSLGTATNRSGGIQGGISNGEPILFRVAFKPTATIAKEQKTVTYDGKPIALKVEGRHDPCVVPRAVPIVEAMAALVLADAALGQCAR